MPTEMGADAHDATGFANNASKFKQDGYTFVAQYIDQYGDANTGGSPSVTAAQIQQETSAGLKIVSIFQTNGMSSSAGSGYQTYFTAAQGISDAQEAIASAKALGQPPGSAVYFAMDFDPAIPGAAGTEANLLSEVRTYLTEVNSALTQAGYQVGVYGAGDTLAAAIRGQPPVAQYGWLTQSYGWAGSNPQTDANAQGWDIYQGFETSANGVAIDPDTAQSDDFGEWTVCFASGTLIRTTNGDVAVEELQVGDLVLTASGEARPIKWLGHRRLDCRNHPDPQTAWPVRVAAHAFGPNKPACDLTVSPGHSICVDVLGQVLIPASSLINGATIRQVGVEEINYWHIELDSHDIIFANNLPTESYIDMGNRAFFADVGVVDARPDMAAKTNDDFCRPFHQSGSLVEAVRMQLRARAPALGWSLQDTTFAGLHLVVDGERVEAEAVRGLSARFLVPADASTVWLESDTVIPRHVGRGDDTRQLGVCLARLNIDDGFEAHAITAEDDRLSAGFHAPEAGVGRWTNGRALLPADLWAGSTGAFFLRVDLAYAGPPRWVSAPVVAMTSPPKLRLVA